MATFVNETMSVEHARDYGHVHLSEVAALADRFKNFNILFIHFSARYEAEEITRAIETLPKAFKGRDAPLLEGFLNASHSVHNIDGSKCATSAAF
ncbi:unnamed protein product [Calypogeia fissa]